MSIQLRIRELLGEVAYRRSPPWDTEEPAPELVELTEGPAALPPARALDLGCGTGTNAIYLARRGWEVTGVDLVHNAIVAARGIPSSRRDAYAAEVTSATAPGALLLMLGMGRFTRLGMGHTGTITPIGGCGGRARRRGGRRTLRWAA